MIWDVWTPYPVYHSGQWNVANVAWATDMPSINRSREAGELQDMYRRALAASWGAQAGELPADQCIEDIFSGGDGWKSKHAHDTVPTPRHANVPGTQQQSDEDDYVQLPQHRPHHNRTTSGSSVKSMTTVTGKSLAGGAMGHKYSKSGERRGMGSGTHVRASSRASVNSQQHGSSSENSEPGRLGFKHAHEVDEFAIREDLMAWKLPGTAA